LTPPQSRHKSLKNLSFVEKIARIVSALNVITFVDPKVGVIAIAVALILRDAVKRIGDVLGNYCKRQK
jgi:hypothetical protein